MNAGVQENKSKQQDVKNERFLISTGDRTMCEFSAYVAFDKATNGQTEFNNCSQEVPKN